MKDISPKNMVRKTRAVKEPAEVGPNRIAIDKQPKNSPPAALPIGVLNRMIGMSFVESIHPQHRTDDSRGNSRSKESLIRARLTYVDFKLGQYQ